MVHAGMPIWWTPARGRSSEAEAPAQSCTASSPEALCLSLFLSLGEGLFQTVFGRRMCMRMGAAAAVERGCVAAAQQAAVPDEVRSRRQ